MRTLHTQRGAEAKERELIVVRDLYGHVEKKGKELAFLFFYELGAARGDFFPHSYSYCPSLKHKQ